MRFIHNRQEVTDLVVTCDRRAATLGTLQDMVAIADDGSAGCPVGGVALFLVIHINTFKMLTDLRAPLWEEVGPFATLLFIGGETAGLSPKVRMSLLACYIVLLHDDSVVVMGAPGEHPHVGVDSTMTRLETLLHPSLPVHALLDVVASKGFGCPAPCVTLSYKGVALQPWTLCGDCPLLAGDMRAFLAAESPKCFFGPFVARRAP